MFLVISILACMVRTGTKLYMIKTVRTDDILIIVATVRYQPLSIITQAYPHSFLRLVKQPLSLTRASTDSASIFRL